MKPKVYTSIDMNEARSPLVRMVHADEWDLLMNELRHLRGERAAVVAWLRERANSEHPIERGVPSLSPAGRGLLLLHADCIERGEHRREVAR